MIKFEEYFPMQALLINKKLSKVSNFLQIVTDNITLSH